MDSRSTDEVWAAMEPGVLPWYVNERMKEREKGMVEELQVCSLVIDMQSQWEHMMAMQTGPNCWALGSVLGD